MKKVINFWFGAMVLALCVGFSSCSGDDDESAGSGGSGELYLDGNKLTVYDAGGFYLTATKYLSIAAYTEKERSKMGRSGLSMDWVELDINSLNVGDDLCKKGKIHSFFYNIDLYTGYSAHKNYDDISVIVKDINLKKNQITLEFKDTKLWHYETDKYHTISGKVTAKL